MDKNTKAILKAFIRSLQHFIGLLEQLLREEGKEESK